ncbi:MAG: hypothetical protein KDE27_02925 [Planctomycetes bacterium]|nr:hypothetical protein [Planctomycetota bacterium]
MSDQHQARPGSRTDGVAPDSRTAAHKPSREAGFPCAPGNEQNALDVPAGMPLHVRPVITYAEVAALGICPERTLRRLVATGRVQRAVLRAGRRVRFVVQDLLDELREAAG